MLLLWLFLQHATALQFNFSPDDVADFFKRELGNDPDFGPDFDWAAASADFKPQLTAAFDSCPADALDKHRSKSFGATLDCGGNDGNGKIPHQTACTWKCAKNKFVKIGKGKTNAVTCTDGNWKGLRKAVCVEQCTWADLRKLQINGEFGHCRKEDNFGANRFICKVEGADEANGIKKHRRARCSCAQSRQSGKCNWVPKGVD